MKDETHGLDDNLPPIGDLEPPLDVLELLTSSECFKENLNMEVGNNPIISLFNYEFAAWKPPPLETEDVVRSRKDKTKIKRDRKAEVERAKASAPGDDIEVSTDSSKAAKSRKRASVAPVGQASVPRVVNDVDNRDSFHMFNAGWILPPDQKRGGRASAMDRSALPPPRKRPRTGG